MMAAHAASCAHCGTQGVKLKRCSVCLDVSYCGAECQKAGWKGHKQTCELPLPLAEVYQKVGEAHESNDWRGVLTWEGRMEELVAGLPAASVNYLLHVFARAHELGLESTGSSDHALSAIGLEERRVELLGKMERFRDQGAALCSIAKHLLSVDKRLEAEKSFQRARRLGSQHGFGLVESEACLGLGKMAMAEERYEDGVQMLLSAKRV